LRPAYFSTLEDVLSAVKEAFARAGRVRHIRLHGDCHPGNLLWTPDGPHFVDFDDTRMGPSIQDLWMLLSGEPDEMEVQLGHLLRGYAAFFDFDFRELHLIEPLRALRMIHYSAWLAVRWGDPAFPRAFPWFNTQRYWEDQVLGLREQLAALQRPSLSPG
jgi:Ser/Thr protein kinase RdoA (MazF antagonist)